MPVGFKGWIRQSAEALREEGAWGMVRSAYNVYLALLNSVTVRRPLGTNIYERDWDTLVILDACRLDAMQAVAPEYGFIEEVDSIWSVASTSYEWMWKTFQQRYLDEIRRTSYVSGNPYVEGVIRQKGPFPRDEWVPFGPSGFEIADPEDFVVLDEVHTYGIDDELDAIPPRTMTDRAVAVYRNHEPDRLVVHYMQPHTPYLGSGLGTDVLRRFERGEVDADTVWDAYLENLRKALDEVELLLENVNSETVAITADHGEALGELNTYGHPFGFPHPCVRRVPWVETTATDTGSYEPSVDPSSTETTSKDIEEHLKDLGYV